MNSRETTLKSGEIRVLTDCNNVLLHLYMTYLFCQVDKWTAFPDQVLVSNEKWKDPKGSQVPKLMDNDTLSWSKAKCQVPRVAIQYIHQNHIFLRVSNKSNNREVVLLAEKSECKGIKVTIVHTAQLLTTLLTKWARNSLWCSIVIISGVKRGPAFFCNRIVQNDFHFVSRIVWISFFSLSFYCSQWFEALNGPSRR